ncbi:class I SAM-dependent methyltransferase [Actinocrispum wychmicini]|uniref:class I SAM-dependent methyltransferase n=1 Tax=Actinocrispum wychmicini TaxID=1213861 RepID=UPI0010488F08|nr:class I SAM-dependent methyltransferase [Actinocrispum wychmicini]
MTTIPPEWLRLREGADAAARSTELVDLLRPALKGDLLIRDLGCGTGSMGRWLTGRLPNRQRWILHDRDPQLLALAITDNAIAEQRDITSLRASELAGTSLVTASALLDLLTEDEMRELARACVKAGCPALFALSVTGQVEFARPDRLDREFMAAFNEHQRRETDGRRLLGPDAADAAVRAFGFGGFDVHLRPSPWRLGPDDEALAAEWLRGWVSAAREVEPDLPGRPYLERRLTDLRVVVHHTDLLAIPKVVR